MTVSRQPKITEELLSAYLDDQVTVEERTLVEEAIATDPAIAWQVDSLRQTVHLLQALPPLAMPRSFSLEAILAEARAAEETPVPLQAEAMKISAPQQSSRKTVVRTPVGEDLETTWWQWFIQLCQGGNLQLRNAAAIALTLFFVLFAGDRLLVSTQRVVEMPPTGAAPVILTSSERIAVEASVVPAVEPTATTAAANSNDQPAGDAAAAVTANPLASTAEQTENYAFQAEGAPMGAPGPREEDLTGGSGASTDAPMTEGFRVTQTGERESADKSAASMAVVAANTAVTQDAVVAEPPLTTVVALSVSEVVTNANVVSSTAPMSLPLTVVPTSTGKSTTPTTSGMPLRDEGAAWLTWLTWAQMMTALSTVVLTGLWWRSRR